MSNKKEKMTFYVDGKPLKHWIDALETPERLAKLAAFDLKPEEPLSNTEQPEKPVGLARHGWVNGRSLMDWVKHMLSPSQSDQWDESLRGKKMSEARGRVIFKYQMPVLERFTMRLPVGAKILRVKDEGGMFWMWAEVRTDVPDEERKFWAFKTGGKIPDELNLVYIGFCAVFVQMELGLYIYEEVSNG